ncbi:MAG: cation:proton antiporter [Chitinophagales bacterium]
MLYLMAGGFDLSNPYILIIGASLIIMLSFLYNGIARKTNIPSVLLLILTGIGIKLGLDSMHVELIDLMPALELLGIIGLIMIVLEASLELGLTKETRPLILKGLLVAFFSLILSTFLIAGLLWQFVPLELGNPVDKMPFIQAMIYATPLAIMSSAIIIPSVSNLSHHKKEFMIYEGTFSDILGIMLFYFLLSFEEYGSTKATQDFFINFALTLGISLLVSYVLVLVFRELKSNVRLFLLIAVLLFLYSIEKLAHLSPLLMILIFGLMLKNHKIFFSWFSDKYKNAAAIDKIRHEFEIVTFETAFVVRTFFFVVFGMSIVLSSLVNLQVLLISLGIIAALYLVRFLVLGIFVRKDHFLPELFLAPRGLITILLFYAIPTSLTLESFDPGILLYVIIISSLIMTYGLILDAKNNPKPAIATTALDTHNNTTEKDRVVEAILPVATPTVEPSVPTPEPSSLVKQVAEKNDISELDTPNEPASKTTESLNSSDMPEATNTDVKDTPTG